MLILLHHTPALITVASYAALRFAWHEYGPGTPCLFRLADWRLTKTQERRLPRALKRRIVR